MTAPLITRRDYMSSTNRSAEERKHLFRRYYGQFVTEDTLRTIKMHFTTGELAKAMAADEHLNTIPLNRWDALCTRFVDGGGPVIRSTAAGNASSRPFMAILPIDREALKYAGEVVTKAVLVCIAKEAARQLVEEHQSQADPIPDDFWGQIDHQLRRIASGSVDTLEKVCDILLDPAYEAIQAEIHRNGRREFAKNTAFFAGSGGDATLREALQASSWQTIHYEASYFYDMRHAITGSSLSYIEGDIEPAASPESA